MVLAVDAWAAANPQAKVFAQIGPGASHPKAMEFADFVSPTRATELMRDAELIVAHAGMGSILTALKYQRPILILPRKASLGEHRNEHQLATARWLCERPGITVAWETEDLAARLDDRQLRAVGGGIKEFAEGPLVDKLSAFIAGAR